MDRIGTSHFLNQEIGFFARKRIFARKVRWRLQRFYPRPVYNSMYCQPWRPWLGESSVSCECGLSYIGQIKRRLYFHLCDHKLNIRHQETNKSTTVKHCWENDHSFDSAKIISRLNSTFELDFLKVFHAHKNHNHVINYDFAISPSSDKFSFYWFSFQFQVLQVSFPSIFLLVNPFEFLQFYWLLLFTLGSSDKLYTIRAEFPVSLCTEDGLLNAIETEVYIFSSFL